MEHFTTQLQSFLQQCSIGLTPAELTSLRVQCMEAVNTFFDQLPAEPQQPVSHLSSHEVTVEFVDEASSLLYRRALPIDLEENVNGIKLIAEDMHGHPLQMVFYAASSARRIHDLMGEGPDEDACQTHS